MTLRRDQRSHGKAERSWTETASPDIVHTWIQLDFEHSWSRLTWAPNFMGCEPTPSRKEGNQTITSFHTGWLWSGSGLDPPRIGPKFLCMLQLGCSVTRRTRWAGSKWTAWLLLSLALQQCQLGSLTAWMCNSCSLASGLLDSLVARQLGWLTVWPYNGCSLTAWQRGWTTSAAWLLDILAAWLYNSLLLGFLAGWRTAEQETKKHEPSLNQTSTRPYIKSFQRSGWKVWINSLGKVWIRGLDRLWTAAWSRPYFLSRNQTSSWLPFVILALDMCEIKGVPAYLYPLA